MSIFARFFFFFYLRFTLLCQKIYIKFIYWIQNIIRAQYVFYENNSSDIKYSLNFKIQSKLINYNSYKFRNYLYKICSQIQQDRDWFCSTATAIETCRLV